jgi:polar amino acid transport system permease protein
MGATVFDYMPFLLGGVGVTLALTFAAILLAVPVAFVLAFGRMSQWAFLRWPAGIVIETFRGTSAVVQLFWAFYVLPFFGINLSPIVTGILVLGLNEGSFFSEVVRVSLKSIALGQREAAVSLHLPRGYTFFHVVLPQALPVMVPPFGNSMILMLKFTALASLVTIQDLAFRATLIANSIGRSGAVYVITLIIYFVMALCLAGLVLLLERAVNRWAGKHFAEESFFSPRKSSIPDWAFMR